MILGIYGAGGLGRELLVLAQQLNDKIDRWEEFIFLEDSKTPINKADIRMLSFAEAVSEYDNNTLEIIIAVGEPSVRKLLKKRVTENGFRLSILVHPSVSITKDTRLGAGTVICSNCFISCNVTIGENVLIQPFALVGHDTVIGDDTVISSTVSISGGCHIGNETYIGVQVPVKEGIHIGNQTIVGMGSVVTKDITDQVIALGNPARTIKNNIENKVFHKKESEE